MDNKRSLPLVEELRTSLSALELFMPLSGLKNSVLLDSAMDPHKLGRYSLMGYDPFLVFKSRGNDVFIQDTGRQIHIKGDPLEILGSYLEKYHVSKDELHLPCYGGAVGYLSYDLGRTIENIPARAVDDLQLPECILGFYDVLLVYDHLEQKAYLVSTGFPEISWDSRLARAEARLREFKKRVIAEPGQAAS